MYLCMFLIVTSIIDYTCFSLYDFFIRFQWVWFKVGRVFVINIVARMNTTEHIESNLTDRVHLLIFCYSRSKLILNWWFIHPHIIHNVHKIATYMVSIQSVEYLITLVRKLVLCKYYEQFYLKFAKGNAADSYICVLCIGNHCLLFWV